MKLQILGSGAGEGIPAPFCACPTCEKARALGGRDFRTRSSTLVNDRILLDFSPDMFYNAYRFHVNLQNLTAIVFTHSHIDHLASAELCMRAPIYCDIPAHRRLPIYGNANCLSEIDRQLHFDLGHIPEIFEPHLLSAFQPVSVGDLRITPLPAHHAPGEHAFLLLLEEGSTCYLHCMDTAMPCEESLGFLKKYRLRGVTMDCTYGNSRDESDSHMGLAANVRLKNRLEQQGTADHQTQFFLSHIAHHATLMHEELTALAAKSGLFTAYDGFEVQL